MIIGIKNKRVGNNFLPKNKKSMALSIGFLVFATVILMGSSLVMFTIRANEMSVENSFIDIEDVYSEAELTDFYIMNIMEYAVSFGIFNEQDFINKFKDRLSFFRASKTDDSLDVILTSIESQLKEDNVEIRDNNVFLTLNINIIKERSNVTISYSYSKVFEENILSSSSGAYINRFSPELVQTSY